MISSWIQWIPFPVEIVGQDKGDREGDKHQACRIKPGNENKEQDPGKNIKRPGKYSGPLFSWLETVYHIDTGHDHQQQEKAVEYIDTEMIGLE